MIGTPLLAALLAFAAPAVAADAPALPDPTMTPGAVDPRATLDVICNRTTRERRAVTSQTKAAVLAGYNIPEAQSASYEIDHLVPLALGGSNAVANLWPQPWAEADRKDQLEVEMQRRACVAYRTLTPGDAAAVLAQEQREIADDWPAAYWRIKMTEDEIIFDGGAGEYVVPDGVFELTGLVIGGGGGSGECGWCGETKTFAMAVNPGQRIKWTVVPGGAGGQPGRVLWRGGERSGYPKKNGGLKPPPIA